MSSVSCKILPGREIAIKYNEVDMRLFVDMNVGIGGDKWPAADQFCSMISSQRFITLYRNIFKGRSVIELGSGSGLVGIFVSKQFEPTSVCITDLDSYKEHITHNVQLNSCGDNVSIEVFDWLTSLHHSSIDGLGHDDAYEAQGRTYDIVLALECVYKEDLYTPLVHTLLDLMHADSICFLGSTKQFTTPVFFQLLTRHGLVYKKIPHGSMPSSDENIGIFVIHRRRSSLR